MWINVTVREHCDQGWNVRVHAPFRCIGASFVHNYITSYAWSFFILYFSTNRVRLKEFFSQRLYSLQPCAWFSHGSFSICVFVLREWYWSQSTSHETFLLYDVDHGMNIFLSLLLFLSSLFFFSRQTFQQLWCMNVKILFICVIKRGKIHFFYYI